MDMIGRIRHLHARKNKSEREIARMTGLTRNRRAGTEGGCTRVTDFIRGRGTRAKMAF